MYFYISHLNHPDVSFLTGLFKRLFDSPKNSSHHLTKKQQQINL